VAARARRVVAGRAPQAVAGRTRRAVAGRAPRAVAGRTRRAVLAAALLGVAAPVVAASGCSAVPASGATGTSCGQTRTAVNVPVVIMVAKGTVDCATAMRVEAGYAAAVKAGDLRGNGGGAPVAVDGWTCESYPTQEALRTGDASECHTVSTEVVAVLSLSSVSTAS
jgi:hypothetical protein